MGNAIAGFKTRVDVSGDALTLTNLALSEINDDLWEVGSADDAKSVFNPAATFTVEASEDSAVSYNTLGAAEYEIDPLAGRVDVTNYTSGSGNTANITNVRISGEYLPRYNEASAYSANVNQSSNLLPSMAFSDENNTRINGLFDIEITLSSLSFGRTPIDGSGGTEDEIMQILGEGRLVVLSVVYDSDTEKYVRAFTKMESLDVSSSVDGRVEGEFVFQGSKPSGTDKSFTRFTRGTA